MELLAPSHWRTIDFISDLHLQCAETATFDAWSQYMRQTTANAIFILGDLFEVWVGDDILDNDGFEQRCSAVINDAARRASVFVMHGNRDFLMGARLMEQSHATLLDDPTVLTFGEQRWLLTHGDALCLGGYRLLGLQGPGSQWHVAKRFFGKTAGGTRSHRPRTTHAKRAAKAQRRALCRR